MRVQSRKEGLDLGKKEEGGWRKERDCPDVELPDANGTFTHPARIFASGGFADNGKHSYKARKKKESLGCGEKSEALVQHVADGAAEVVQRHL